MPNRNIVKEIRKATRRKFSAEDKIRIVLLELRGKISVSELYRVQGIPPIIVIDGRNHFLKQARTF